MNRPSLQRSAFFSLLFHLGFFLITILTIKNTIRLARPAAYTVNLIGPERQEKRASASYGLPEASDTNKNLSVPGGSSASSAEEERYISEAVSALEAKKKIEKIVKMRNIISLKRSGERSASAAPDRSGRKGGSAAGDYIDLIQKKIRQNWIFPDMGGKNIEAVVAIRISKDGTIHIEGFEKGSGNSLFDRSVIRAITKADRLPPPPDEMEIGVRFYP